MQRPCVTEHAPSPDTCRICNRILHSPAVRDHFDPDGDAVARKPHARVCGVCGEAVRLVPCGPCGKRGTMLKRCGCTKEERDG